MVHIAVNERSNEAKAFLEYAQKLAFVKVERKFNKETLKAIEEVKEGKVIRAKNVKDLMKKLKS